MRYEDMLDIPGKTFKNVLEFSQLEFEQRRFQKALDYSSFKYFQKQEQEKGVNERAPIAVQFFCRGRSGGWHEELSEEQTARIIKTHKKIMHRFGDLDRNDQLQY